MGVITNIRLGFRLENLCIIIEVFKQIRNWWLYFLDLFSLSFGKCIIIKMRDLRQYRVRARTCDRGIITTVHLQDEYRIRSLQLSSHAVVIDVGAHIGIFSTYIARTVGQVYAYEPEPENYKMLERNIALNMLGNKVLCHNCGISDRNEQLHMYYSPDNTSAHSIYAQGKKSVDIGAIPLWKVFQDYNIMMCDLLKIDTEGCEYKILYGLPCEYFSRIQRIYLEHHTIESSNKEYTVTGLALYLKSQGYEVSIQKHLLFAEKS